MLKVIFSIVVILAATAVAKKFPSAAGLIGVMPLTGALVLVWVYLENEGNVAPGSDSPSVDFKMKGRNCSSMLFQWIAKSSTR